MPLINRVGGGGADLQSKSKTPTTSSKTYYPDSGYDGFSSFTVNAIPKDYVAPSLFQAEQEWTPITDDQTIPEGTYCSGKQTIKGDTNLVAGNIKSGVSIFGVRGTVEGRIGEVFPDARNHGDVSYMTFHLDTANLIGFFAAISESSGAEGEDAGYTGVDAGEFALLSLFVDITRNIHVESWWRCDPEDDSFVYGDGTTRLYGGVSCGDGVVTIRLSRNYTIAGWYSYIYPIYSN